MLIECKGNIFICLIDNEDIARVSLYNWHYCKSGYVCHSVRKGKITNKLKLHKFVMNNPVEEIDHVNHNKLDNRKTNLRLCTHLQNQYNRVVGKNNKSGVKGVSWSKIRNKWSAQLNANNTKVYQGFFADIKDAADALKTARSRYHENYACHG